MVQEVDEKETATDKIIKDIRRAVAQNQDVEVSTVVLIKPGSIPKTSSGKIQRSACRDDFQAKKLEVIAERDAL